MIRRRRRVGDGGVVGVVVATGDWSRSIGAGWSVAFFPSFLVSAKQKAKKNGVVWDENGAQKIYMEMSHPKLDLVLVRQF